MSSPTWYNMRPSDELTSHRNWGASVAPFFELHDRVVQAVHVINPANLSVVKTITEDQDGNPLSNEGAYGGGANISRSWNDAVLADVSSGVAYSVSLMKAMLHVDHLSLFDIRTLQQEACS